MPDAPKIPPMIVPPKKPARRTGLRWYETLLLLPLIALMLTSTYARQGPSLFGFPFFYWYLFLWVPLGAGATAIVFMLRRRERP